MKGKMAEKLGCSPDPLLSVSPFSLCKMAWFVFLLVFCFVLLFLFFFFSSVNQKLEITIFTWGRQLLSFLVLQALKNEV